LAAPGVQILLLFFALFAPIIFGASLYGIFPLVKLSAAKGTAKINTACITGMGEKKYVAVTTPGQAFSQMGFFLENRTNNPIIPRNNTANLFTAVPIGNRLKIGLNLYYKKARCSLMSLIYVGMPSLFLSLGSC